MSHSGVPVVSQLAGLISGAEGNGNQPTTPAFPPAAPTLATPSVAAAGNTETEQAGQGIAANILGGTAEQEEEPQTASSMLLGS